MEYNITVTVDDQSRAIHHFCDAPPMAGTEENEGFKERKRARGAARPDGSAGVLATPILDITSNIILHYEIIKFMCYHHLHFKLYLVCT